MARRTPRRLKWITHTGHAATVARRAAAAQAPAETHAHVLVRVDVAYRKAASIVCVVIWAMASASNILLDECDPRIRSPTKLATVGRSRFAAGLRRIEQRRHLGGAQADTATHRSAPRGNQYPTRARAKSEVRRLVERNGAHLPSGSSEVSAPALLQFHHRADSRPARDQKSSALMIRRFTAGQCTQATISLFLCIEVEQARTTVSETAHCMQCNSRRCARGSKLQ